MTEAPSQIAAAFVMLALVSPFITWIIAEAWRKIRVAEYRAIGGGRFQAENRNGQAGHVV
jgi:hypothetical protein